MLRVGLTGGIGCGKSAVAGIFAELGIPVVDADVVARSLVEPGQPALDEIVRTFGEEALEDGRLNRTWLREKIFHSSGDKQRLESILHPKVYADMENRMAGLGSPYCILVIPLLLETGRRDFVHRLLVVDCPEELQIARVKARDSLDECTIHRIVASQVSRAERLAAADDLLENDGELETLKTRVRSLHQRYLALAECR